MAFGQMDSAFNRKQALGGFTEAVNDTYAKPVFTAPTEPAAAAEGAKTGDQTFTGDPGEATKESFYQSMRGAFPFLGVEEPLTPLPPDVPVPSGISQDEIAKAFAPIFQEINSAQAPAHHVPPPPTPAMATFLSVLAGSLGAQLTKNPAVQDSIMRTLAENQQRRQAIEDQNYANDLMFNQQKDTRRLAAMGQLAESELENAIKNKDFDRAAAVNKNLETLKSQMNERELRIQGQEQRKTQAVSGAFELAGKTEKGAGAESKPLEPKDYLKSIQEIASSKPYPKEGGFLGMGAKEVTSRQHEIGQAYAAGFLSGNADTKRLAARHLMVWGLQAAGLGKKKLEQLAPKDVDKIEAKLQAIGVSLQDLAAAEAQK